MPEERIPADFADCLGVVPVPGRAPIHSDYPMLRIVGDVALVGLCSSIPTSIFRAGGRLGSVQLERLEGLLDRLGRAGLCRILMIHHPITTGGDSARRALWDGASLREVLGRVGAELVLHGHKHRRRIDHVAGPEGEIPVIGVPSTSEVGSRPDRPAQYHLYTVERGEGGSSGFSLRAEIRGYDGERGEFAPVAGRLL
jgi:3',5'-cyclic AMP phosphodiesterase CpdA